ncbi:MAG: lipopolysaccharide biosynthesis protein [Cyclobacteriaceae bacterium]|jgi:O-antigen/teichoic acid export membrane protein|nr:oligosaccharide flippase family protein [Flammeovirgaceae bacterium]
MLKVVKSSVKDTVIYSLGTFATKLSGFILVPLYTNTQYLTNKEYGVLNLVEVNLQVFISVFGLGICYAYERWYWDSEFINKRKSLFFTIIFFTSITSLTLVGLLSSFSSSLSQILFKGNTFSTLFTLMLVNAAFEIIAQTPNSLIRLSEKPALFTSANITKLIVSVGLTVLFTVKFKWGLEGIYYAQIIGIVVYFIVLSKFIYKNLEYKFEWRELINMIQFRFPFLLPIVALNLFNFNDRYILANVLGTEEVGVYSLGAKLANTIKVFIITAIWMALTPTIYKMMNDPNNKRFYSKIMTYLSFVVIFFVMTFSFFSKELVELFATEKSYERAQQIIPLISLGIFFGMLKDVSLIGLNISKRTFPILIGTITSLTVSILFNFLLIPNYGIIGASLVNLFSQIIFFIIILSYAQKYYHIPYELKKIGLIITVFLLLFLVSISTNSFTIWARISIKAGLLFLFPIILYWLDFFEEIEIARLKSMWVKWRDPLNWKENLKKINW